MEQAAPSRSLISCFSELIGMGDELMGDSISAQCA
jgi:hypothetical protein